MIEIEKKFLETVTLLGIDCVDIKRLSLAANICQESFDFASVKLLTSLSSDEPNTISIPAINSTEEYSQFITKKLVDYVDTPHVLLIQYDGFILNPDAWQEEFLKYDYIGAPWLVDDWSVKEFDFPENLKGKLVVGNGGFSLRSKNFLTISSQLIKEGKIAKYHPEDVSLCVWNRNLMEGKGIKFAPAKLAKKFSFEAENDENNKWDGQFGFHGIRWTDISKWTGKHTEYKVDAKLNTISKINKQQKIENYLKITKDKQPSLWLPVAIDLLGHLGEALDLGYGAGRDTKFLLEKGFKVTAVDKEPKTTEYLKELPQENLKVVISSFEDLNFEKEKYDLVNAQFSLFFTDRDKFNEVFNQLKQSLKPGGVFVGQLLGVNDDWNKSKTTRTTFHTKEEAQKLFDDMELLKFVEKDYDGTLADGTPKHWHIFHIIAKKK